MGLAPPGWGATRCRWASVLHHAYNGGLRGPLRVAHATRGATSSAGFSDGSRAVAVGPGSGQELPNARIVHVQECRPGHGDGQTGTNHVTAKGG